MKFYDTGNTHDSLAHYVWHLLGDITSTDYPLADLSRATNTSKLNLALKIWRNQDDWDFDDTANTDFPIATTTIVDNQADYTLPTDALEIRRVEVKDINGNWTEVIKIDETNIDGALDEYQDVAGIPNQYRLESNSIILYPAPDTAQVTATAGLKVTYNRKIDEFTGSTTTTEVGMGELGDQIIAFEVAEEWAIIFRNDRMPVLQNKRSELEQNFLAHISKRSKPNNRFEVYYDNNE